MITKEYPTFLPPTRWEYRSEGCSVLSKINKDKFPMLYPILAFNGNKDIFF
jgi:hypothetical protein